MENDDGRIVDAVPGLVWTARPDGQVDFLNRPWCEFTGSDQPDEWQTAIHPDDLPELLTRWRQALKSGESAAIDVRLRRADGAYRWFLFRAHPFADASAQVVKWCGLYVDIDERKCAEDAARALQDSLKTGVDDLKRAEALLAGEKQLLEMVARGRSMPDVLEALCRHVESTATGCYCSVVLVDASGTRLEHGAAPSLPASFITSIIGRPVNLESGPCAMAAYLNEQVIATDLTTETRWAAYQWCPMALAHGLQAAWSTPIVSADGTALGAFAIYYDEPRTPTPLQQSLIERFTHIASIAVERAQGDAALRRSEARKAAVLDSAIDCIVTIDHEGRITEFNPAAERTFGYRRDEAVGKLLADVIIPPSLHDRHRQGLARYIATGEARILGRRVEMTAVRSDGTEFPVELAVTRVALDGPPSFTGYLRDITERKRAEEELRRSEAFLAQAQEVSSTGSFSWRVATEEITWSEELYRIFGFEPGTPVTLERIGSRIHPDDVAMLHDMIERAGAGRDCAYDHRLAMPDGSVKYLHLVLRATRDRDGQLEYIGAAQDITGRRLSELALGRARSELAQVARVTSLGALTASIAHEVNQPLTAAITNGSTCVRWLAADPPNLDEAGEAARRMIRDGRRAAEVIARLRAFFGQKAGAAERINLSEATREVMALLANELQESRAIVRVDLDDRLPLITGDRVQLQQVIVNLVLNALDAIREVDGRPRHLVIRTERDEGDRVRLTVQDAGVGFEPQAADRLFEPFYTTKSSGMGIGLSLSRTIIESHHGRLWAVPNESVGATFAFSIPSCFDDPAGGDACDRPIAIPDALCLRMTSHGGAAWPNLLKLASDVLLESSLPAGAAPLESILCTEELHRRPSRPPDYEKENRALVKLVSALADSPSTIFQTLAETILDITQCDSAGLSLLTRDGKTPDVCGQRFYWPAIAGMWNPHVGGGTPRNFGPCGDVLDQNRTLLFTHFERRYPYLLPVIPAAEECLLVPFYVAGEAVGTIWAIMHSDRRKFDAEDDRIMASLGKFASSAYQALKHIEDLKIQVSEREKAEAEVRELAKGLEAKIRRLVEANVVGIVMWNLEGAITGANDAFLRMVQYDREDLASGRVRWTDLTPAEWRGHDEQAVADLKATGIFQPFEKEYFRKDGSRVPVLLGGALFEGSGNEGVAFVLDLSDQKRAERALRRSEAFLAEGQRLSQMGSFSWRVATDEVTWSEQLYRIYEFEIGVPVTLELIRTRVHPEDVSLLERMKMVDQAQGGGNDFEWQYRLMMPDHSIKYLHAVAHATRDEDGQLEYIAAVQDVTARRLSEDALDKARAQLTHVARVMSLGVLTASIAHELNQPLSGIITNANTCLRMLAADPPDVDGARETARRTIRDGNRASEVIVRLRALFTKKESTTELVDLNEATREVIALSSSDLQRNRVVLRQELADDLPAVVGDRVQLQQVILNLLLNAATR